MKERPILFSAPLVRKLNGEVDIDAPGGGSELIKSQLIEDPHGCVIKRDRRTVAVARDRETAKWIANEMHDAPILRQKLIKAYSQNFELLAALKASIEPMENLIRRFVGTLVEHKFNELRFVVKDIKQAIIKAEGGQP